MLIFLNIVYAAFLFCLFALLVSLPFALIVWAVRRWYATHRLGRLPWRRRRALLGVALLWSAAFSKLSPWRKAAGISAILSLILVAFVGFLKATTCQWTLEDSIARELQLARYSWLRDDCPQPLDPLSYLPQSGSFTGVVYRATLNVKDPDLKNHFGLSEERKCRSLFAIKEYSSENTYIIATTGEILVLDSRGGTRLLRKE